MIILIFLFIFLLGTILIFSSKRFSPIPYFPSNRKDLSLIINSLNLKNGQIVYDLGAGDGLVIFAAAENAFAKKLNTKFVAVEINPILLLILHLRRFFHRNRNNIKILKADIFSLNFHSQSIKQYGNITVYLYISPWFLEKVIKNCLSAAKTGELRIKNFRVVSYMYPIKSLKKKEKISRGKNSIFLYNL